MNSNSIKLNRVMTVDPGDNTAWAIWNRRTLPETGMFVLDKKIIKVEDQFKYMWEKFEDLISGFNFNKVYIEGVEVYTGSLKSKTASVKRKGQKIPSLFKLAFLIGGYCRICTENYVDFEIINFSQWGGQMPPNAVQAQIRHLLNTEFESQHIYDAVGMGLYLQGKL